MHLIGIIPVERGDRFTPLASAIVRGLHWSFEKGDRTPDHEVPCSEVKASSSGVEISGFEVKVPCSGVGGGGLGGDRSIAYTLFPLCC
ncbi:MAG: hypothetical protein HC832_02685 [Leptolyngbyaceae cyanobacterium RM1_405_57]|nr:hypothetical protein [Leptolyngbyaceae cyanobacterium RM1_405_57]